MIGREVRAALVAVVVFTVLLGLAYPLVVAGIGEVVFPGAANGSLVRADGREVGSRLIGQDFRRPVLGRDGQPRKDAEGNAVLVADRRYFQSRPSPTDYNAAGTAFSNLGPNSKDLRDALDANALAYLALERPYDPGLTRGGIPGDAVFTSASSVDPHISPANARIQARRVAAVRRLDLAGVLRLVDGNTDERGLGVLGQPGVNVLELNLALDREAAAR